MASLEVLRNTRQEKCALLRAAGMNPYASVSNHTHTIQQLIPFTEGVPVVLAGRIMSIRGQGALIFIDIFDGTGKIQGILRKEETLHFQLFNDTIDIGDFIECTGVTLLSKTGQQSIQVASWNILTKSIRPLPDKWHGLQDTEERFRKRYLDILMDEAQRTLFEQKSHFWRVARSFMLEHGFLEVETPTLEVTTGGAEATPFKTYHEDFNIPVYLRISVGELWQKRLMAAGFPKTFEIGRVYRNEGTDMNHVQEFTNLEFYMAYANYETGMQLVQALYTKIVTEVFGTTSFSMRGHQVDFSGTWPRIDYVTTVQEKTGVNILTASDETLRARLEALSIEYTGTTRERMIDTLWKYCRKQISGPVFLIHHPKIISPLAKVHPENPELTERFQVIIAGSEVGNGFSELNDPEDQRERFIAQQALLAAGDKEAMMPEWEFVDMLESGMPPTCGFGFGEMFFALLVDKPIRETQLFPLMKPKQE